jgi:hypothetical protein
MSTPREPLYPQAMLDRLFLPALVALTVVIVALAMVWPQGLGDRSPGPFGSPPVQRTPAMQKAMRAEAEASQKQIRRARDMVSDLQTRTVAPAGQ